jgi:hypothetical protein
VIAGGAGGAGGSASAHEQARGGIGGVGAAAIDLQYGNFIDNKSQIIGGAGGAGGSADYGYAGAGGVGGAGVVLVAGFGINEIINAGLIAGGAGGAGGLGLGGDSATSGKAGVGVDLAGGARIINEARIGTISGYVGLYAGAGGFGAGIVDLINFGTIEGTSGVAVEFTSRNDHLVVEQGSVFVGAVDGGGGSLTLTRVSGSTAQYAPIASGFGSYVVASGGIWIWTGPMSLAAHADLTDAGVLGVTGAFSNDGRASVLNGGRLALTGVVSGAGEIVVGGSTQLTLLRFSGPTATLTGGGSIVLGNSAENGLVVQAAACVLTNASDKIMGAGLIGGGLMMLVNQAGGSIVGVGSAGLTLNTAANTIINGGLIEADRDTLTIDSAIDNDGRLYVLSGSLVLMRAATGAGAAYIHGGTLSAMGAFGENVVFLGGAGALQLAQSQSYGGAISGFAVTGATSLDLRDIGFVGVGEASFSGSTRSGVLTVTDGAHTARIAFLGNYTTGAFICSSDGHGGVTVIGSTQAMISAMAGVSAGAPAPMPFASPQANAAQPLLVSGR